MQNLEILINLTLTRLKKVFKHKTNKNTPKIPQRKRTSIPAMERRLAASRNIIDGSSMEKD